MRLSILMVVALTIAGAVPTFGGDSGPSAPAPDEAELARETRVELVLRLARQRNPDLREALERAGAAAARASGATAFPEPEAQVQLWQQPLARPFDPKAGGMVMLGLRQALPAPGLREARGRAALADAEAARAGIRGRELDVVSQVRRAFAEYALAELEQVVHLDHMELTSRFVEMARAYYQDGRLSKQDLLRASAELARLHADVVATAQARRASGAFLNVLMGRDPDAPLGPARLEVPAQTEFTVEEAEHALEARPDLVAAHHGVERSRASLDAARRGARWPGLMLGTDWGYMPVDGTHNYTLMLGGNLPWLWGRRDAEVREAERNLAADQAALESVRRNAAFQVREAKTRLDAAREAYDVLDGQVVPQTRQAVETVGAAFASGQEASLGMLDSLRAYLQVRLERTRALARLHAALADLEKAAGHLHGLGTTAEEGKKP